MTLESILQNFGISETDAEMLASNPHFHHKRKSHCELGELFNKIAVVYSVSQGEIIAAVLKFPPFASYDHARVVRERVRLGHYAGISKEKVLEMILQKPVLASYSAHRYIAGFDITLTLLKEGFPKEKILNKYFTYISKSPYVTGFQKERISHIYYYTEPPLMTAMRNSLSK